ncbi:MAG: carboxypeptidase-like regulatory domain-containing protein [Vicinamibacteria bacterium]
MDQLALQNYVLVVTMASGLAMLLLKVHFRIDREGVETHEDKRARRRVVGFLACTVTVAIVLAVWLIQPRPVERNAVVRGVAQDADGRSVEGVRVSIVGYGPESVQTDKDGTFVLPIHAALGGQIRLRTERIGFEASDELRTTTDLPITIRLIKAEK